MSTTSPLAVTNRRSARSTETASCRSVRFSLPPARRPGIGRERSDVPDGAASQLQSIKSNGDGTFDVTVTVQAVIIPLPVTVTLRPTIQDSQAPPGSGAGQHAGVRDSAGPRAERRQRPHQRHVRRGSAGHEDDEVRGAGRGASRSPSPGPTSPPTRTSSGPRATAANSSPSPAERWTTPHLTERSSAVGSVEDHGLRTVDQHRSSRCQRTPRANTGFRCRGPGGPCRRRCRRGRLPDDVLLDDRPGVELGRHVVACRADQLHASGEGLVVGRAPTKLGRKLWWMLMARRAQRSHNCAGEDLHEPGEHNGVGVMIVDYGGDPDEPSSRLTSGSSKATRWNGTPNRSSELAQRQWLPTTATISPGTRRVARVPRRSIGSGSPCSPG